MMSSFTPVICDYRTPAIKESPVENPHDVYQRYIIKAANAERLNDFGEAQACAAIAAAAAQMMAAANLQGIQQAVQSSG